MWSFLTSQLLEYKNKAFNSFYVISGMLIEGIHLYCSLEN